MSNVVPLRPDRRSRTVRPAPTGSAEIVFFTGVRYVRSPEPDGTADPQDRKGPARARIERLQA